MWRYNTGVQDENPKVLVAAICFFQRMVNGDMLGDKTPPLVGCTLEEFTRQHSPTVDGRIGATNAKNWIKRLEKISIALFCTNEQKVEYANYKLMDLVE